MAKNSAVDAVSGQIFREGWSKVRGSMQGLGSKPSQMARAAKGSRAAVFKPVRSGGCQNKGQLTNQLEYLTTKSSHIVDSRGVLDGKKTLSADEIKSLADRFSSRWDDGFRPKMGHTTHMLMSYPIGTKGEDVRDITSAVCEKFFANDERNFDYIIAVHEDRAHPHAHIVLNRRSQEGEYFFLGRDHHFNYDDFRLSMVEEAEKVGVRLEATRRIDRGDVTYTPRTKEIYDAKREGREPVARERVGRDLDRALIEVATASKIYRGLAVEASSENREDISNALFKAGEILARGGKLEQNGEVYMNTQESFDDLRSSFNETALRVEQLIKDAPQAAKAGMEKQMDAVYKGISEKMPLGSQSSRLNEPASETGIYSEANINTAKVGTMKEPDTRAQIETALRDTGISSSAVIARIEQGASNASLEDRWIADDLTKIAKEDGLNLERTEDREIALAKLDQVHVRLADTLVRAEVIREDGYVEGEGHNVAEQYEQNQAAYDNFRYNQQPEQQAYLDANPEILASPTEVYAVDSETLEAKITNQSFADQITIEVDAVMERAEDGQSIQDAVADEMKERYPDMPDHLAQGIGHTYEKTVTLNEGSDVLERNSAQREDDWERAVAEDNDMDAQLEYQQNAGIERAEIEGIAAAERQLADEARQDAVTDAFNQNVRSMERAGMPSSVIGGYTLEMTERAEQRIEDNPELVDMSREDRREFEALENDLSQTADFLDGTENDAKLQQDREAQFDAFAAKSPEHAALASRAWDKLGADLDKPDGFVEGERETVSVERANETTVQEIDRGVAEHYEDDNSPYGRYERLGIERNQVGGKVDGVAMGAAFVALAKDNNDNATVSVEERQRTEEYLKDTADQHGDFMRDQTAREDTREFRAHEHEDFDGYSADVAKYEQERLREFDNAIRPYRGDQSETAEMRRVIEHEREEKIEGPFDNNQDSYAFRDQIERELDDDQLDALREGDADALDDVIDDRLDRLYAAKAYLQSDPETANSEATREVVSEIVDEEFAAQRLKTNHADTEKGQTHG